MKDTLIGILAGMGPRSTAPFIDMVIDQCQLQYGAKLDEEFPRILIYSLPTPFYVDKPINHKLMEDTIIEGLQKLEAAGADFIAMPCNSAHIYFDQLERSIKVPMLNIVKETVDKLPGTSQRVTLFSTSSTFDSGIYQNGLSEKGHIWVYNDNWQIKLNMLIQGIKRDKENPGNICMWKELLEEAEGESVESVIIACTDLNVVLDKSANRINFIDSSKCLSERVVNEYIKIQNI